MTIEYTYPERPKDAKVDSPTGVYFMRRNEPGEVFLINHIVRDADVPLVCEAMMTLAGWPTFEASKQDLAERIIARLEEYEDRMKVARTLVRIPEAIAIVREECGVAE